MDTFLSVIGVLGLGAFVIALWVFLSVLRRTKPQHHSEDALTVTESEEFSPYRKWAERSSRDRRQNPQPVLFPITLNGVYIPTDRRIRADRRRPAH